MGNREKPLVNVWDRDRQTDRPAGRRVCRINAQIFYEILIPGILECQSQRKGIWRSCRIRNEKIVLKSAKIPGGIFAPSDVVMCHILKISDHNRISCRSKQHYLVQHENWL
jgi:hypothetical protein